ncbi:MAG: hypothetical protein COV79_02130 [Parcubacteria group bacterium CG11_big_fil_rev_8_21_14_0_20_41_14]|nr:MAG: hypothetical protein COV79_02130 [Parcubacteria group bacterium CG11_big_fil_rev_8_21_14_0_20_41_14]PIR56683.1 MAG: hypothetical protein COU72_04920 [Parcubacteria group bacterium CG10_big_fil_rev_8_21_14_0_10_41_35]
MIKFSVKIIIPVILILLIGTIFLFFQFKISDQKNGLTETGLLEKTNMNNEIKHTVPLDQIVSGGPPKDGIPPIDKPKFVDVKEADSFLSATDPGVAVSLSGIDRFYPFQILVWHEIVNDTFRDRRVLITYCPLCYTAIVFDPVVQDERVEFGTSGKLYESNLVMYDRKTDSYWSQILGQAIAGEVAGQALEILPSDVTTFGEWKKKFPDGHVLSRNTGADRFYGVDPYGDYYSNDDIFFRVSAEDDRLEKKDFILGIVVNGKTKAYYPPTIKERGEIVDIFEGKTIMAKYDAELDVVQLFEKMEGDELKRINPFGSFWFSWVAVHPDTELYK